MIVKEKKCILCKRVLDDEEEFKTHIVKNNPMYVCIGCDLILKEYYSGRLKPFDR